MNGNDENNKSKPCLFPACGGLLELNDGDPPGYITSPNYPSNYPTNIDCVWIITVPNGEAVQLDFEDNFYIESHPGYVSYVLNNQIHLTI